MTRLCAWCENPIPAKARRDAVCRWIFTLLGACPGDILDDLFPGSGAVARAWAAYTGQQPSPQAPADTSSPAASDTSYPSPEASHDAYAQLPLEFAS